MTIHVYTLNTIAVQGRNFVQVELVHLPSILSDVSFGPAKCILTADY